MDAALAGHRGRGTGAGPELEAQPDRAPQVNPAAALGEVGTTLLGQK